MLAKLSLRIKLFVLSGLAIAALIAVVVTGFFGVRSGVQGVKEIGRNRLPSVMAIQTIHEGMVAQKASNFEVGIWENDSEAQDQFAAIARDKTQVWQNMEAAWQAYQAIPKSAEEAALWENFVKEWQAWKQIDLEVIKLIEALAGNKDAARQSQLFLKYFMLGGQQRKSYFAAEKLLNQVVELNARNVKSVTEDAEDATELALVVMLAVGVGATLSVVLLAFLVTRSILRQMGGEPDYASTIARSIADGNLSVEVLTRDDDADSLLFAMKTMRDKLNNVLREIEDCSKHMGQSAYQVSKISNEISDVGRQQESRSGAVSGAMLELHATSSKVQEQAIQATARSGAVENLAQRGIGALRDNILAMQDTNQQVAVASERIQELEESAQQIHSIVNTIKDIAGQTNLLALNAAIEAARAGEQGRGFAVVADEVRKLAERTARSATEVSDIIGCLSGKIQQVTSTMDVVVDKVKLTRNGAESASQTIEQMAANAIDSAHANQGIADASQQQLEQFALLEATTETLFTILRENGTKVDTTATIGDDLRTVTGRLNDIMSGFSFDSSKQISAAQYEKRSAPRAQYSLLVKVTQNGTQHEGICTDFSLTGLRLRLTQPVRLNGGDLELSMFLPNDNLDDYASQEPLALRGRIAWQREEEGRYVYGIEFSNADDYKRSKIRQCFAFFKRNPEF